MESHDARALLEWYAMAGIDEATDDTPQNRMADPVIQPIMQTALSAIQREQPAPTRSTTPSIAISQTSAAQPALIQPSADAIAEATTLARNATTLEELHVAIRSFDGCPLKRTANNTVIYDGSPSASIMLIGEAPGADEDRRGIPFCGASGQLLDKILNSVTLSREHDCFITNMIYWRPPGNRNPTADELAICRPFVERHIALIAPSLIILTGGIAAKSLLQTDTGITRLRKTRHSYHCTTSNNDIPTMAIFHPSYLLRQPAQKKLVWQDMLRISTFLSEHVKH